MIRCPWCGGMSSTNFDAWMDQLVCKKPIKEGLYCHCDDDYPVKWVCALSKKTTRIELVDDPESSNPIREGVKGGKITRKDMANRETVTGS